MGDYHFIYKDVEGRTTQWDDIQTKLGNLPPKPAPFKPPAFTPAEDESSIPKDKAWLDNKTEQDLEDLEDDPELDDDRFLEEYRKQRLAEMREAAKIAKFGSVMPISGADFVREVSQAPSDVWVVVCLYKEGIAECGVLLRCLDELATRYPATKFVKIISTECIPNYPDRNVPTIFAVALILCQSDPVLNDGQSSSESSRDAVLDQVRRNFIEKVVTEREDADDGYNSD
ncbi:hypothetical protein MKW92_008154 [Papaver armeniacum]|nr:hypothetical protein MKW92_008154 [Papaver armeniacum]